MLDPPPEADSALEGDVVLDPATMLFHGVVAACGDAVVDVLDVVESFAGDAGAVATALPAGVTAPNVLPSADGGGASGVAPSGLPSSCFSLLRLGKLTGGGAVTFP